MIAFWFLVALLIVMTPSLAVCLRQAVRQNSSGYGWVSFILIVAIVVVSVQAFRVASLVDRIPLP